MRFTLVMSIALGLVGSNALAGENNETLTRTNTKSSPNDTDDKVIRRVEEQMLTLNKSNDAFRNKRALGILLQGFMEALGYTVAPIQLGSLPIGPAPAAVGTAAPQMPPPAQPMNLQQGGAMPPPQGNPIPAPPPGNAVPGATAAAASTPPRQRETLRFTGVLNFGNNSNSTNLIDHLSQYERIFHGGATPQPLAPSVDPRSLPPLPEPLFVQIPLPIVPNLPPPQAPSPMPVENTYNDNYQQQHHEEEFKGSEDDEGQKGNFEEEDEEGHHHEEYEHSQEEFSEPEDEDEELEEGYRKYQEEPKERKFEAGVSHEKPPEKNRETHYKKNQHVVNYSVENKEIHDPSEVSEEVPIAGSKYGHTMYAGEPDWKQKHEDHAYRLAAEQEARAEALAEENAERERSRSAEIDDSAERHQHREKEISENNEKHAARYEATSREHNPYYDDVKEKYNNAAEQEDYEEETETRNQEMPTSAPLTNKVGVTNAPASRRYEEKVSKSSSREDYQDDKSEQPHSTLPISYDREGSAQHQPLRDSYGESLEKPGGKVDDRVADYITMFKNPKTGVYESSSLQQYGKARIPYDRLDLVSGFKKIQKEYGRPESKYEEYEINEEDENPSVGENNNAQHREGSEESEEREQHSKSALTDGPHTTECNCNPRKNDALTEEAKNLEKPATARLPITTPTPLAILDYGPYYSTVRHLYDPSNDQGIIARLTSYGPPTTGKFEAAPTVLDLPERLTAQSLIQQSETKEITAWPAPFDYVFDNSDHRSVVLKNERGPTRQTPLPLTKPTCYREGHTLPPGKHADRVHMLIREHERDSSFSTENTKKRKRRPQSPRDRKAEQVGQHSNNKDSYHPAVETTQTSVPKQGKTPQTTLRSESGAEKIRAPTVPSNVLEPPTAPPHIPTFRTTKTSTTSTEKVKSAYRQPKANRQLSRPQTTAKKKQTNISATPLTGADRKEERSNYVEKNGIFIIPEPTPYYYNENIEAEFSDEPQRDTENVKVKEFRNRIASVKVSQVNQLHPDSSMQIFKYSRNL